MHAGRVLPGPRVPGPVRIRSGRAFLPSLLLTATHSSWLVETGNSFSQIRLCFYATSLQVLLIIILLGESVPALEPNPSRNISEIFFII